MSHTKPKVLFVQENWVDCNPALGPASGHHNFIGSLQSTGLAEHSSFYLDDATREHGAGRDQALMNACQGHAPDFIFLKLVQGIDVNPRPETFAAIRDRLDIPIVAVYGDMSNPRSVRWMETYANFATVNLLLDCYSVYPELVADTGIYRPTWTPQDPSVFFAGESSREIDVSFVGSVARYPERKLAVGLLAAQGVDIFQAGGDAEVPLAIQDYAEVMRRSRIALNFSRPVFDEPNFHCKGRVWEATLCGAMLMEQENPETAFWLEQGRHYVGYDDERDLVEKTLYYLAHEDERAAIAAAGHQKVSEDYTAENFWRQIFELVGLKGPIGG